MGLSGFFFPLVITKAWLSLLIGWLLYSPGHFFNVSTFSELKSSKSGWYDSKLCALSVRSAQGFFWCRSPNREWRICRADGSYILFYINDATLHQAERWSGRKLFFTRPQENEKNNISVNFLRWFFWINEPLKSAGSVTNVLLIVFDLPASPNWVCRPRWIMRGWLSSFLFPNAASSAFFPWKLPEYIARLFFVFLKSRAFKFNKAADLLEVTTARGVWAAVKPLTWVIRSFPSLICVPARGPGSGASFCAPSLMHA